MSGWVRGGWEPDDQDDARDLDSTQPVDCYGRFPQCHPVSSCSTSTQCCIFHIFIGTVKLSSQQEEEGRQKHKSSRWTSESVLSGTSDIPRDDQTSLYNSSSRRFSSAEWTRTSSWTFCRLFTCKIFLLGCCWQRYVVITNQFARAWHFCVLSSEMLYIWYTFTILFKITNLFQRLTQLHVKFWSKLRIHITLIVNLFWLGSLATQSEKTLKCLFLSFQHVNEAIAA